MKVLFCLLIACLPLLSQAKSPDAASPILGQWISEKKDLIVEVYLNGPEFRAKIVWVSDRSGSPETRLDEKNPVPSLRSRRVLGMDVLKGLTYNQEEGCWENGHIYDATSGKTWAASARLADNQTLIVRGYWSFEMFGKTLRFSRYK